MNRDELEKKIKKYIPSGKDYGLSPVLFAEMMDNVIYPYATEYAISELQKLRRSDDAALSLDINMDIDAAIKSLKEG